jgi:hypothetical protein
VEKLGQEFRRSTCCLAGVKRYNSANPAFFPMVDRVKASKGDEPVFSAGNFESGTQTHLEAIYENFSVGVAERLHLTNVARNPGL